MSFRSNVYIDPITRSLTEMLIINRNGSATLSDCCHTVRCLVSGDCNVSHDLEYVRLADGRKNPQA